ncbi:MAG: hypothetical protein DKINENOH_03585 [bacterium]|nr:hypothetical protein [bacterium]
MAFLMKIGKAFFVSCCPPLPLAPRYDNSVAFCLRFSYFRQVRFGPAFQTVHTVKYVALPRN